MRKIIKFCGMATAILLLLIIFMTGYVANMKENVAESVLRLHIIGESDSEADQQIKLRVRDRIIRDFKVEFEKANTQKEARHIAMGLLDKIEASANDELKKYGTSRARASVENCKFPTKIYSSIALPGGEYTALNIKIGNAKGKNWWCVMYPPLCVTDESIVISDKSLEKLKSSLSEEEYRLISQNKAPDIQIKFKIAEIIGKWFN